MKKTKFSLSKLIPIKNSLFRRGRCSAKASAKPTCHRSQANIASVVGALYLWLSQTPTTAQKSATTLLSITIHLLLLVRPPADSNQAPLCTFVGEGLGVRQKLFLRRGRCSA